MQSDGSEWGYEAEPATPTYNYFPQTNYPGSAAYNYPGYPITNAAAKEVRPPWCWQGVNTADPARGSPRGWCGGGTGVQAYIQSYGEGAVHQDGSVGTDHVKDDEFNFGTSEVW